MKGSCEKHKWPALTRWSVVAKADVTQRDRPWKLHFLFILSRESYILVETYTLVNLVDMFKVFVPLSLSKMEKDRGTRIDVVTLAVPSCSETNVIIFPSFIVVCGFVRGYECIFSFLLSYFFI